MPGCMNGAELARQAQQVRPRLKVLYTSGYTDDALTRQGRGPQAWNFSQSPTVDTTWLRDCASCSKASPRFGRVVKKTPGKKSEDTGNVSTERLPRKV